MPWASRGSAGVRTSSWKPSRPTQGEALVEKTLDGSGEGGVLECHCQRLTLHWETMENHGRVSGCKGRWRHPRVWGTRGGAMLGGEQEGC